MKNMKVKLKLLISFLAIAVITAIVGGVGVFGLLTLNSNENVIYKLMENGTRAAYLATNIQQQRIASRNVIMEIGDIEKINSSINQWDELITEYDGIISFLNDNTENDEAIVCLATISDAYEDYIRIAGDLKQAAKDGDAALATQLLEEAVPPINIIIGALDDINSFNANLSSDTIGADSRTANIMVALVAALAVVAMAAAILLGLYISNLISRPISTLTTFMIKASSTGDLTLRPEDVENISRLSQYKDEIGQCIGSTASFMQRITEVGNELETIANGNLASDFKLLSDSDTMGLSLQKMTTSLNNMFGEIHASTSQVASGSKQIANGAQSLAQGSTEQASAIEQLSASIGEISIKTKQNADIAKEAADLSGTIRGNAEKGSLQMDQMMQAVREISDASVQIEKVIKVIDDIAFQTNILALNAAVEAARAGAAGKGFAVVAEEVRNLAAKSADAAKDTGGLIENSVAKANLGLGIATETSASLKEIVEGINRSAEIVAQIARSSDEQAGAISQINTGIDQVAQVVQQNSATAEESAAASEQMSGQSDMLEQLISQFKLRESEPHRSLGSASNKKTFTAPQEGPYSYAGGTYGKY